MHRRNFIKNSFSAGCLLALSPGFLNNRFNSSHEALYYHETPRGLKCLLCPKECTVKSDKDGYCMVRIAEGNKLITLNYGKACYINEVKTESLSLFHYFPGSSAMVLGAAGCNLTCLNCPVSHVSQKSPGEVVTQSVLPADVIQKLKQKGIKTLVFGYSEPVVFYEYMLETAKLAKQNNIKTVLSSSGYISEEPMRALVQYLDAAIIDIKAFSDASYIKLSGGSIYPPFKTLKILREADKWLELTHKIIPGYTDNLDLVKEMCKWMMENGYQNVPLHFNTFKPVYKLSQTKVTPVELINKALEIGKSLGLHYVYSNNSKIKNASLTYCPRCQKPLVDRSGKSPHISNFVNGKCTSCNNSIEGIW